MKLPHAFEADLGTSCVGLGQFA